MTPHLLFLSLAQHLGVSLGVRGSPGFTSPSSPSSFPSSHLHSSSPSPSSLSPSLSSSLLSLHSPFPQSLCSTPSSPYSILPLPLFPLHFPLLFLSFFLLLSLLPPYSPPPPHYFSFPSFPSPSSFSHPRPPLLSSSSFFARLQAPCNTATVALFKKQSVQC